MEDQKHNELDMLFVLRSIKKGISNLLASIGWLFNFSIKKILPLSAFIIVSVGVSLWLFYSIKPYYKSEASISHIRLDNQYCYEMITNLGLSLNEASGNIEFSKKLQISEKVASKVKAISYAPVNINLAKLYNDSINVLLPFKVQVEVYDNSVLTELQKGILNYLESNEYAVKLKEIDRQSLEKVEQRIQNEVKEVDSLKQLVNESIIPRGTGNGIIMGEPIDPVNVYNKAMASYERLLNINRSKILNNSFEIMVGFNSNHKVSGHGRLWYIAIGLVIGYVIGILFLIRRNKDRARI